LIAEKAEGHHAHLASNHQRRAPAKNDSETVHTNEERRAEPAGPTWIAQLHQGISFNRYVKRPILLARDRLNIPDRSGVGFTQVGASLSLK